MKSSQFNVRVPLPDRNEVFLMNTFTDTQTLVAPEVITLLDRLNEPTAPSNLTDEEREAVDELTELGFVVKDSSSEWASMEQWFHDFQEASDELRITVLTTLQCNFACDYCFQGDHDDYNKTAAKMTLETAAKLALWIEDRVEAVRPETLFLTFFGGEPLLNLPVLYDLAERTSAMAERRGVKLKISLITNGLLLTPEVVDRLLPLGLIGAKITLDGDRDTHNRMRPLRGRQGTFDRIVDNIRSVVGKVTISIGGNFDESSVDSFPALLDFLRDQEFADQLGRVNFKPIIGQSVAVPQPKGIIPLTAVSAAGKPLNGSCMTSAGAGHANSPCGTCNFVDEKMAFLREETKKHGFKTVDGVHMGPCEVHRKHAHTIGPDGSLYACPGFTGEAQMSIGHIDGRLEALRKQTSGRFDRLAPWRSAQCTDCSFIPVCAGGCSAGAHAELGDMDAPTCHKASFESALISLAHDAASASAGVVQ